MMICALSANAFGKIMTHPARVDPLLPAAPKMVLTLEAIGEDKVRIKIMTHPARVDPLLPAAPKMVLTLEAIGEDKVRINSSSLVPGDERKRRAPNCHLSC
jgi:hypothetical protein